MSINLFRIEEGWLGLKGRRVMVVTESTPGRSIDKAMIKALTGADSLSYRSMADVERPSEATNSGVRI